MKKSMNQILLRLILLVVVQAVTCLAQPHFDPIHNVPINIYTANDVVEPGSEDELIIQIYLPHSVSICNIDKGSFFIEMKPVDGIDWRPAIFPKAFEYLREEIYRGIVIISVPFTTDYSLDMNTTLHVEGIVGYQLRVDHKPIVCFPPLERNVAGEIKIGKDNQVIHNITWQINPPVLVGGNDNIQKYIKDHNLFPEKAFNLGVSGIALIGFTVDIDGKPICVHILQEKPEGLGFGEAGLEVMKNMMFTPARQRGKIIQVPMHLPIRFLFTIQPDSLQD